MRGRVRVGTVVAAVMAGGVALGGCEGLEERSTFDDDTTVPQKITAVRLDNGAGRVALRGREGDAKVRVHRTVRYRDDRPAGATHRVESGALVLRGCGRHCSVDYTVDVPAGIPVTGSTSSGAVSLSDVGAVRVGTSSGRITLDDVAGTVDVHTSNGRITGRALGGGAVRAKTSNGAIDLVLGTPQDVRAETSNGAVTLTVPTGRYRVTADTGNGGKKLGVPNDPAGKHRIDLKTSNGSITLKPA